MGDKKLVYVRASVAQIAIWTIEAFISYAKSSRG
jgi:hypothetical protein